MNVQQTVNISTNIDNERIKTKYIPSYIFENEGKIFKKAEIAEVKRVSGKITMLTVTMHKLLVSECLTGAKGVR